MKSFYNFVIFLGLIAISEPCRQNSNVIIHDLLKQNFQVKKELINFFRMSKRFHIFWQIKWKHFECRKKSTLFFIVLKVWNLFDIVSERLNFFEFSVEFLRCHFLLSKFFSRNSCSRNFYAMKCRKNSVVKKSPCRKNSVEINTV